MRLAGLNGLKTVLFLVRLASVKPNADNAPIRRSLSPEQTDTVTDPCHPLYGRTLPLVGVTNKANQGRCCVVWIRPDVERIIPVQATDLESDPSQVYPIPLSIASVEAFLQVFKNIQCLQQGSLCHVTASTACQPSADCTASSLEPSGAAAATTSSPPTGHHSQTSTDATEPWPHTGGPPQ